MTVSFTNKEKAMGETVGAKRSERARNSLVAVVLCTQNVGKRGLGVVRGCRSEAEQKEVTRNKVGEVVEAHNSLVKLCLN